VNALKRCPNPECGSENVEPRITRQRGGHQQRCGDCGLTGPLGDPTGEKWNALPRAGDDFCVQCAGEFAKSLARKEIPQTPVTPRTIRAKIRVHVDANGPTDAYLDGGSRFAVGQTRLAIVEADVPLPEEPECIEGGWSMRKYELCFWCMGVVNE
jgi:hypothetical protein